MGNVRRVQMRMSCLECTLMVYGPGRFHNLRSGSGFLFYIVKIMDCNSANQFSGVMDYEEACFMHLNPGVVQNFPKTVDV